jgi:hypothetical protein
MCVRPMVTGLPFGVDVEVIIRGVYAPDPGEIK